MHRDQMHKFVFSKGVKRLRKLLDGVSQGAASLRNRNGSALPRGPPPHVIHEPGMLSAGSVEGSPMWRF